jgi:AraC-like DNA-binding protein
MNNPEQALSAIRNAERFYNPAWNVNNKHYGRQYEEMYAMYYLQTQQYDRALNIYKNHLKQYEEVGMDQGILEMSKAIADAYFEKGDRQSAAESYRLYIDNREKLNKERFYAQINELRTLYELDKAEMEVVRSQASLRVQRSIIAGLFAVSIALAIIVVLVVWSRKRMAEKNRILYRKIMQERNLQSPFGDAGMEVSITDTQSTEELILQRLEKLMLSGLLFTNPKLTRNELAKHLHTNETYLANAIRNHYNGQTLSDYINSKRLVYSDHLLQSQPNLSIKEISVRSGFQSYEYYHRLFHAEYGMSPSDFRKASREVGE